LADKKQFSDGWFVPTMPDLNQRQPILATYLIQNALWWIEFADLSGIRVDTYSYSDKQFLAKWTERIMNEYPAFNIVGEEWTTNTATAAYWQAGKINHDGYVSALPSVMDFSLQQAVVSGLNEPESWNTGLIKIYQSLANDFLYADPNKVLVFADNHDMSRVFTELDNDIAKTKMALGLLLTTRGIPQLYYATEVLAHNNGSDAHGVIRVDFPGGFGSQAANGFTGVGLEPDQRAMQEWLKKLLNYRKQQPVFATGNSCILALIKGGMFILGTQSPAQ
jgi:neopullulanase